jgi:hypothetical protein
MLGCKDDTGIHSNCVGCCLGSPVLRISRTSTATKQQHEAGQRDTQLVTDPGIHSNCVDADADALLCCAGNFAA